MRSITLLLTTLLLSAQTLVSAQNKYHSLSPDNYNSYEKKDGLKVAYVGGIESFTTDFQDQLTELLDSKLGKIEPINVTQPYIGSIGHAFALQKFLYSKTTPDILFIETVADDLRNKYNTVNLRLAIEGIIRKAKNINPDMDIFWLMLSNDEILEKHASGKDISSISVQKEIAKYYGVNTLELSSELAEKIKAGELSKDDEEAINKSYISSISDAFDTLMKDQNRTKMKFPKEIEKKCFQYGDLSSVESADSAPMFTYHEDFTPNDGTKTYENFISIPTLTGERSKNSFFFEFKGSAIGTVFLSGPDSGMVEFVVNGRNNTMFNIFTDDSKNSHYPRFLLGDSDLSWGSSYLAMIIIDNKSGDSKGNVCRIVYFMTNEKI